jgi:hypothetical protein
MNKKIQKILLYTLKCETYNYITHHTSKASFMSLNKRWKDISLLSQFPTCLLVVGS